MAIPEEKRTIGRKTSPTTSGVLSDLWRIGEPEFILALEARAVPQWQLTLVKAIKAVGEQALGKPIVEHAEYDSGFELSQFRTQYPLLCPALDGSIICPVQLAEGMKNIHYGKDHAGLEEVLTILPPSIKAGPENVRTSIPLTERIPITRLNLKEAPERIEDTLLGDTSDSLLYNLNQYLSLGLSRPHTLASIQQRLQEMDRIVIPLKRSSKAFNFWIEGPPIEISKDGKRLAGNIKIEAATFFDRGCDGHRPRVLLMYSVNRHWTRESLAYALRMEHELKARIDLAWRVEGEHVQMRPLHGGGFQGK